jgi:aminoglycoside phosphotransferase (APT) family kinase protein
MKEEIIDQASGIRKGEELDKSVLQDCLKQQLGADLEITAIKQFPSGYSNLTYLLETNRGEFVLRKPPLGANIKTAHDMEREFKVLSALKPVFPYVPNPITFESDTSLIGTQFYLMERISGLILRAQPPKGMQLTESFFQSISTSSIDLLAQLHQLDLKSTGLDQMGKPEGYVKRQVEGWVKRYFKAKTDELKEMEAAAEWLLDWINTHETSSAVNQAAFIHNDFKYDNLVLSPESPFSIKAVLDWEMATLGHPLMDLGTTLAYWCEANDHPALKAFSLTWMPGNLSRQQVIQHYQKINATEIEDIIFYYVFGCFKVAVIGQQIYARYKKGLTKDPRFGGLIHVIRACGKNTQLAIQHNRINNFY